MLKIAICENDAVHIYLLEKMILEWSEKAHKKVMKNTEWIKNELKRIKSDVEIIGEYKGRHNKVKAKCKICGYEWYPIASSLLRGANHKGSKTIHNNLKK